MNKDDYDYQFILNYIDKFGDDDSSGVVDEQDGPPYFQQSFENVSFKKKSCRSPPLRRSSRLKKKQQEKAEKQYLLAHLKSRYDIFEHDRAVVKNTETICATTSYSIKEPDDLPQEKWGG
jgi:hypothetical protein